MQTLPACREHTLQVNEGCAASRALTETMLRTTTLHAIENGQGVES